MTAESYRHLVRGLFPLAAGRASRSTAVAVEHELAAADAETGAAVPIARLRAATSGASYSPYVSFEPGGQVELSLPPARDAATAASRAGADIAALRADCAAAGVVLHAWPVDPRPEAELPLQLTSARYQAMQRHFDTIGPAGRVMMRRTGSTQVCLDWWSGREGVEQWQVLNLAGPFLAAAFARATGPGSRLATWLAVDPDRTAFDGRLLAGDDPVAAYAAFAADATPFVPEGAEHLTTLFPPVRPRGRYLEVRFPDVQEDQAIGALVETVATLVHDDAVRAEARHALSGEAARLEQHWYDAAYGLGDVAARGHELVALASGRRLVGAA
jgi:glutamate--cysteine ligase